MPLVPGPPVTTSPVVACRPRRSPMPKVSIAISPLSISHLAAAPWGPGRGQARGGTVMVARIGFSATTSRESRQGRKAAAAAAMSGAGARAGASCLPKEPGFIHELYRAGA